MSSGSDFLVEPIFVHGFSGSLHLVLLLALLVSWVCKKIRAGRDEGSKGSRRRKRGLFHKLTLSWALGVSIFHLALCVLNYFYWYRNGWSDVRLVSLVDSALTSLAWGVMCVYLHGRNSDSGESKFPSLLRVWWGFYFSVSCYSLVLDIIRYEKHVFSLPVRDFVSDIISVLTGLYFCYVGFFRKNEVEENLLEEPLLNGNVLISSNSDGVGLNKFRGSEAVTPYSKAGILSIVTFSWMSPLISIGNKKTLDLEDVPQLDSGDSVVGASQNFRNKLLSNGEASDGVTTWRLVKALFLSVWRQILSTAFFVLLYVLASYVGPYLIETLVQFLNGQRQYKNEGYLLVSAFLMAKLVECLSQRQWFFRLQQVGIRMRAVLVAMIYEKGLTLSCLSKQGHTSGEIINFMSVDAERVDDFAWYMHDPWMVLLQVVLALGILYKNLGLAAIAAFVATGFVMLANVPLGKLQEKYQDRMMKSKDKRMKTTSEILRNMRILKLQGWEMKFLSKVFELRNDETGWLKKYVYTQAMTSFVFWGAPTFVSVVTFGACMLMGIPLSSGKILSALATFRILQEPIYNLPDTISMIAQTKVSLDRISSFLGLDDLQSDVVERIPRGISDTAVEIINGNFSWDLASSNPTLKDINLKAQRGMKIAVCGTVGSGKSSLLSCILGEMPKISGTLRLCGTKAYVSQSPWIQSGKIVDNILFGKEMDRERYERVLEACSLKKDLEILSHGDQTVIGERGINLSGGQKQRIQIARAVYQDADIYIFDDPFSAVDAHTGSHLFKVTCLYLLIPSCGYLVD